MNPSEINKLLKENTSKLASLFEKQAQNWVVKAPEGKWTSGQHVAHLVQSTEPLLKALGYPSFILKWKFGKNNRENRDFQTIVNRYNEKLANVAGGMSSPFSINMPIVDSNNINTWLDRLSQLNDKLSARILKKSDKNLDEILIPHPLMGRMTLREILMWNAYHTEHHYNILQSKYKDLP